MMKSKTILFTLSLALTPALQANEIAEYKNHKITGVNREDGRATFWYYDSYEDALDASYINAKENISLNGTWKFNFCEKPADRVVNFYEDDFNTQSWDDIQVPGSWPLQGYDKPIYSNHPYEFEQKKPFPIKVPDAWNPVGAYRREFDIPSDWDGKRVILHLGAVKSAFYVWVNGEKVGYSQDSKMQAEFDITGYLRFGEKNNVSIEVYRFSIGSYLEGQDMWRLAGIKRDVWVYATEKTYIKDFFTATTLTNDYQDGVLDLEVELGGKFKSSKPNVLVELLDENNKAIFSHELSKKDYAQGKFQLQHVVEDCKPWSSEKPNLYTLVLTQDIDGDKTYVASKVGFRSVELKNSTMLVNGVAVKVKGVNRHEHHPKFGHYVPKETMLKDVELMKQLNINAVRMCHYPADPYFYELCNEYGLYICDEANIETHGLGAALQAYYDPAKHIADNADWTEIFHDRMVRMFERDKNHPAIITWSMGNECGDGVIFQTGYEILKGLDSTRLVQFEQAGTQSHTDVYAPMYMTMDKVENYAISTERYRPLILCEYMHAMGNSVGNFQDYWDLFYKYDCLQGGFIWDWVDQGLEDFRDGERFFDYGGAFGLQHIGNSGAFCLNGVINPDRELNPHAHEVKKVHQGVKFTKTRKGLNKVMIENRFDFTNLNEYTLVWSLLENGKKVETATMSIDLAPRDIKLIEIPFTSKLDADKEYFLNLAFVTKQDAPFLVKGYEVAMEQFLIQKATPAIEIEKEGKVKVKESADLLEVSGENFNYTFNTTTGRLSSIKYFGEEYLKEESHYDFFRVKVDNDGWDKDSKFWKDAHKRTTLNDFTVEAEKNLVKVTTKTYVNAEEKNRLNANITTTYTIYPDGTIEVDNNFIPVSSHAEKPITLPRIGEILALRDDLTQTEWYGRGPWENYEDRKTSAFIGQYAMGTKDLAHHYINPQENGYRTDVRNLELVSERGLGFRVVAKNAICFNAQYNKTADYYNTPKGNKIRNSIDLKPRQTLYLNIDYKQQGVGGDNSWGNPVHIQYRILMRAYNYGYYIQPFIK